jgi:hydrogenase maturation protease
MEPVSRARRVIFIDAAVGEEPGKVTVTPLAATGGPAPVFTHFATPAALLEGARSLYGARPEALLITVVGLDFELGEELSEPVRVALESLIAGKIGELIARPLG